MLVWANSEALNFNIRCHNSLELGDFEISRLLQKVGVCFCHAQTPWNSEVAGRDQVIVLGIYLRSKHQVLSIWHHKTLSRICPLIWCFNHLPFLRVLREMDLSACKPDSIGFSDLTGWVVLRELNQPLTISLGEDRSGVSYVGDVTNILEDKCYYWGGATSFKKFSRLYLVQWISHDLVVHCFKASLQANFHVSFLNFNFSRRHLFELFLNLPDNVFV